MPAGFQWNSVSSEKEETDIRPKWRLEPGFSELSGVQKAVRSIKAG